MQSSTESREEGPSGENKMGKKGKMNFGTVIRSDYTLETQNIRASGENSPNKAELLSQTNRISFGQ